MQTHPVEVNCIVCKALQVIYVHPEDYLVWQLGVHAQNAFPYLTADERESLITLICVSCIVEMYAGLEEEEDEDWLPKYDDMFMDEADDPSYDSDYYVDEDCD